MLKAEQLIGDICKNGVYPHGFVLNTILEVDVNYETFLIWT